MTTGSSIRKILVVYKKSSYQAHALDERDTNYLRLLRERNVAIRRSKTTHDLHMDTLSSIKQQLRHFGIPFDVKQRYHLKPIRHYDLVLTIGGDGTFLETAHSLEEGLILGVNSVPSESVGFFCRSTAENFLEKISRCLEGNAPLKTLHRLEMAIDGKKRGPLALNDILFSNGNPAGTTRYVLKIGRCEEEQKSSGVWVSPAPGSSAATKSAGGRRLPLTSKKIQYVVREPYAPPGRRCHLLCGVLSPVDCVEILSMMDDAAVFVDGPHLSYPVKRGSRIVIRNPNRPLRAIW